MTKKLNKRRAVLFMISDPMIYPPTINAANIMAEKGWEVYVIGIKHNTSEKIQLNEGVQLLYFGNVKTGVFNILQYILIHIKLVFFFLTRKINLSIAYDAGAVSPVYLASILQRSKWCYHNHDLYEHPKGWQKFIKYSEIKLADKANIISFPQINRAEIFKKEARLSKNITIIWNAPRASYGKNDLHKDIAGINEFNAFHNKFPKILIYQGGLSHHFHLEIFLDVLPKIDFSIALCILGKELENGIKHKMQKLVTEKQLDERVLFLDIIPYDYLPFVTKNCFIGLSKFTSTGNAPVNDFYLAGASNKVSEYLACGLPVLSPDTEINRKFYQEFPIGYVCNAQNSSEIADKINLLFTNHMLYKQISEHNRLLFDNTFNFDKQFEKFLAQLE